MDIQQHDQPAFESFDSDTDDDDVNQKRNFEFDRQDPEPERTRQSLFGTLITGLLMTLLRFIPVQLKSYLNILAMFYMVYTSLMINQFSVSIVVADRLMYVVSGLLMMCGITTLFPNSWTALLGYFGILSQFRGANSSKLDMSKMSLVKCSVCHKCYTYEQVVVENDGVSEPKLRNCQNQHFPTNFNKCNTPLLVCHRDKRGKWYLRPFGRDFLYPGLINQLPTLLNRPDIQEV